MNNLIILDVETGGKFATPNPKTGEHNQITQLALRIVEPVKFKLIHSFEVVIKPYDNTTINPDALKYTRVTMKQINNGVDVDVATKQLVECFRIANKNGRDSNAPILCGHNINFDRKFLEYLFTRKNKSLYEYVQEEMFDTMWLCRMAEAGQLKSDDVKRYTLTACCERWGIKLINAHSAAGDVQATELLLKKLFSRLRTTQNEATEQNEKVSKSREQFKFDFFEF